MAEPPVKTAVESMVRAAGVVELTAVAAMAAVVRAPDLVTTAEEGKADAHGWHLLRDSTTAKKGLTNA